MLTRCLLPSLLLMLLVLPACTGPTDQDRRDLATGYAQFETREYSGAQRAGALYIGKFPNDPQVGEAYYLRGIARLGLGDKAGGMADLQDAASKSARSDLKLKAYRTLGNLAYDDGRYGPAVESYKAALPCGPDAFLQVQLLVRIASGLQALGQWDASRPYLQQAQQLRPEPGQQQQITARLAASSFTLQYGAFREVATAQGLVVKLKALGIGAALATEVRDHVAMYLVRSGAYRTRAEAEGARNAVLRKQPQVTIVP